MDELLFSIIIPVFNNSSYIRDCLNSVQSQKFVEFECVLIDDGSTDGSGDICDEYCVNDARFMCVHKTNGGINHARNVGIRKASGRYILFVDSDDVLQEDSLELYRDNIEKFGMPDVLCANVKTFGEGVCEIPFSSEMLYLKGNSSVQRSYYDRKWYEMAWNKCVRLDLLYKHSLTFDKDIKKHEDSLWSFKLVMCADSVLLLPYVTYNYRLHAQSLIHKMNVDEHGQSMNAVFEKMILYSVHHVNCNQDTKDYLTDLILGFLIYWCKVRGGYDIFQRVYKELSDVYSLCFVKSRYAKGMKILAFVSLCLHGRLLYNLFLVVGSRKA